MHSILLIIHVLMALSLIGLILIQHGKGADAGAAFGSGASSTVFGSGGSGSFLTKATGLLALVFFANSFFLSFLSTTGTESQSLMEQVQLEESIQQEIEESSNESTGVVGSDDMPSIGGGQESDVPVAADQSSDGAASTDLPDVPN